MSQFMEGKERNETNTEDKELTFWNASIVIRPLE